jgi:hypothetical protein
MGYGIYEFKGREHTSLFPYTSKASIIVVAEMSSAYSIGMPK